MRSLVCQWQRVISTGVAGLDFLSVDEDTGSVYGSCESTLLKLDYSTREVLLRHTLPAVDPARPTRLSDLHWLPSHLSLFLVLNGTTLALFHPGTCRVEELVEIEDGVVCACWAPDDGVCVIITGAGKLMLMNEEFDCIKEETARQKGWGSESPSAVGWGSKETQFHGSAGRAASQQPVFAALTPISALDTEETRVSWRGDGHYFAVSTVDDVREGVSARVVRVWTRDGVHTSTNEPVPGLEDGLAWRPSGNLIASTAMANNQHQVIFMERNGLRHGEFPLSLGVPETAVSGLHWNTASTVLAVVYEGREQCHVRLYTASNYNWMLKQHYSYDSRTITFLWDPQDELRFHVATEAKYICYQLSSRVITCSNTTTMVVDDGKVNVTPMARMCIPPPMSHVQLKTDGTTCNAIASHEDSAWLVCADGSIARFDGVHSSSSGGERGCSELYQLEKEFPLEKASLIRHFTLTSPGKALCVAVVNDTDALLTLELSEKEVFVAGCTSLEDTVINLVRHPASGTILVQLFSGELFELHDGMLEPWGNQAMRECVPFAELELAVFGGEEMVAIGRTSFNHLYMDTRLWLHDCTSFSLHKTHLLLTTHNHTLVCVSLQQPAHVARTTDGVVETGIRSLERGSRLVISDPLSSRVVLQMPRGNLELIHPRPLLLTHLASLISDNQYGSVFEVVRKHRVNMNFVYDYHPEQFRSNLPGILESTSGAMMELFVAELRDEDTTLTMYSFMAPQSSSPPGKVEEICKTLINHLTLLLTKDPGWLNTLISCYVKINDIPSALIAIKNLSMTIPSECEAAIRFMLELTDDDTLFNHALSTYNLELVLQVAQCTQKDPKEYLIFLNELQTHDEPYRRFRIDNHLSRYEAALGSLVTCPGRFEEVCLYVTQHSLHSAALALYPPSGPEFRKIAELYAVLLKEKGCNEEAGLLYAQCGLPREALACLRLTSQAHVAVTLASQLALPADQLSALAEQLAGNLKRENKHSHAARLLDRFCDNPEEAVEVLGAGCLFAEALEMCQLRGRTDLVPGVMAALRAQAETTHVLLEEKRDLVERLAGRIVVVRERRAAVEAGGGEEMDHSDLYSDATSVTTASNVSRRSARSAKGRRKAEKKRYSLREGSKFEYYAIQEEVKSTLAFLRDQDTSLREMITLLAVQGDRSLAQSLLAAQRALAELLSRSGNVFWPPAKRDEEAGEEEEEEPVSHPPGPGMKPTPITMVHV